MNATTYTGPKRNRQAWANPWCTLDWERAYAFSETAADRLYERRAICQFYNQADDPRPCSCGGQRFPRMTVGAFQCADCRSLETYAGVVLTGSPDPAVREVRPDEAECGCSNPYCQV